MSKVFKIVAIVLLAALTVSVQFSVWAFAFRVTSNSEWHPVQLVAFVFDGLFILVAWRFLCRKPTFPFAAWFVFASDIALFFLALLAREAPYRFHDWFVP